ncbi:hypothetical protein RHGRI_026856 [Rhododendron griersonianum]|uniref:Uncharacterized protein n=1 Tax=Rhododendron griersonianum TaxID=479676 RepID=A0AAV6IYK9_9ERIC|nr:hypothetical protein RHGRI_026856 [Rhododendron griersonianum]
MMRPLSSVVAASMAKGLYSTSSSGELGSAVFESWTMVNGGREKAARPKAVRWKINDEFMSSSKKKKNRSGGYAHTHTIKSSLSRIPLLFCPSSSLAPSDLTSTVYVRAALTSNTNDADPISNALDPQPRFDDKKKGDTSRGPETETEYLSLGVMDTPNRSTNSNGVSYDWESNSESDSGPSTEDSHSNNFGAQTARYGILSSGYNLMSFYASHGQDSFEDAREAEYEMTSWMRKRWERENNKDNKTDIGEASNGQLLFGVGDPLVVKTKGNPGKNSSAQHYPNPRKCSNCKCRGHDKRTCPKLSSGHPIDDLPM